MEKSCQINEKIRIIALNGSPNRNRNTATLMKWVVNGFEAYEVDLEWINVADLKLNYCKGCHTCLRTGSCAFKDDISNLIDKIKTADGIIVGSPVYEGFPTAQLKTIMDRVALLVLYTGLYEDKFSVGVATSGIAPTKKVAKDIADIFGKKVGIMGVKTASIAHGYQKLAEINSCKVKERAKKIGKKLIMECKKGPKKKSLKQRWIRFLRTKLMIKIIKKNPEQFSGVIDIWKDKGWWT